MAGILEFVQSCCDEMGNLDGDRFTHNLGIWAKEYIKNSPGFFTPFQGGKDVALSFIYPIVKPIDLTLISAVLAMGTAFASLICVSSLFVAGVSACTGETDTRNAALSFAAVSGIVTLLAPLVAALFAVMAVLSLPYSLTKLLTRSGVSVVESIRQCSKNNQDLADGLAP